MKKLYTILIMCALVLTATAQKLVGKAPSPVEAGQPFRLTYTIDTHEVDGFRAGNIPDAFEVLSGPNTSTQSSYQIVNGKMSSSATITYTYIINPLKEGTYTIPPAQINADGKKVTSNSVNISVVGSAKPQGGQSSGRQQIQNAGSSISASDLFINVSVSKRRVNEQEPILLTYKAYSRVGLNNLSNEAPDLKGFHVQEITLPQQRSLKREVYNGQAYNTVVWRQYVIFPQMTGEIKIPAVPFEAYVLQRDQNMDPFEAFFHGGSGYVEVKKKINAPGVTIQVDPLPARPAGFSGGVGKFSVSASIDKTDVKANDPINLRVVVSGTGNLKLIKEPTVNFPKDFDRYSAKQTDKTRLTANGLEGSIIYDFLAVPRHQGKYEIPPVEFVYYNTETDKYETAKSDGFVLNVAKGDGNSTVVNYADKEEVKQLNTDIRYIKTGESAVRASNETFFASVSYWITLIVLFIIFVSLFVIFRQRAIDNADISRMKGKKANKVATKRLKQASKLMAMGKASQFYDEVLRALWGYVGDKLSMPVEQLTRENISQQLAERNVEDSTIALFIGALDECEFERYAPGDVKGNMAKTFDAAMTAITTIENTMKKKVRGRKTLTVVALLVVWMMPCSAQNIVNEADTTAAVVSVMTKTEADSAYAREDYRTAVEAYENLLQAGENADIYYNLGNAYYRLDDITRAVLNYERALRLSPGDDDIRFNLQMAREKTIDKIIPESEMFFVTWYREIVNIAGTDGWARIAIVALGLLIVLALVYLFAERLVLRKIGFFGGLVMIVIFLLSNLFAWQQYKQLMARKGAIIVSSAAPVRSTPAKNGTDLFVLHEGTKVEITDDSMKDWKEIKVADGKEGWIETSLIEVI